MLSRVRTSCVVTNERLGGTATWVTDNLSGSTTWSRCCHDCGNHMKDKPISIEIELSPWIESANPAVPLFIRRTLWAWAITRLMIQVRETITPFRCVNLLLPGLCLFGFSSQATLSMSPNFYGLGTRELKEWSGKGIRRCSVMTRPTCLGSNMQRSLCERVDMYGFAVSFLSCRKQVGMAKDTKSQGRTLF